jgi:hypothetical protein
VRGGIIAFIPVWVIVVLVGIALWARSGQPVPVAPPPAGTTTAAYEPACAPTGDPARLTVCDSGTTVHAPLHSWVTAQLFRPCLEWAFAESSDWKVLIGTPARQFGGGGGGCSGTRGSQGSFFASRPGSAVLSAYGYDLSGGKRAPYRWSVTVKIA